MQYRLRTLPPSTAFFLGQAIGGCAALTIVGCCIRGGVVVLTDADTNPINLAHWVAMAVIGCATYWGISLASTFLFHRNIT